MTKKILEIHEDPGWDEGARVQNMQIQRKRRSKTFMSPERRGGQK